MPTKPQAAQLLLLTHTQWSLAEPDSAGPPGAVPPPNEEGGDETLGEALGLPGPREALPPMSQPSCGG